MLLLPTPFYLHLDPFARVAAELRRRGVAASLLVAPGDRSVLEGLPVETAPLPRRRRVHDRLGARLLGLADLVAARRVLERTLDRLRPALVAVGSDLGDAVVRLLLDRCRRRGVPTLVVATVPSGAGPGDVASPPGGARAARALLALVGLERIPFRGHVYGSYDRRAALAVPSEAFSRDLVASGIDPARIAITGNPRHDRLAAVRARAPEAIRRELGLDPSARLVVYCTERIHEIHGHDYLVRLDALLRDAFDRAPVPIQVVVQLHPGEDGRTAAGFRRRFQGDRYRVVRGGDVHLLVRAADLVLGHYSEVLADTVLLGRPVLSLALRPDPRLPGHLRAPRIEREADLAPRLHEALERPAPPAAEEAPDGRASARVAELVLALLGRDGR